MDLGGLLLGVAAIITAVGGIVAVLRTNSNVRDVKEQVGNGGRSVTELLLTNVNVIDSMHRLLVTNEATNTSILKLLEKIAELDAYTHTRNHDILNAVTPIKGSVELLLDAVVELRAELARQRGGDASASE